MFRKAVKIAVLLVIANAVYQVAPQFWRYQRFKSALEDVALAAKGKADAVIVNEVLELAATHQIALDRDWITVSRAADLSHTYIEATWEQPLTPVPGWTHPWVPVVKVDGWHLRPVRPRELH